MYAADSNDRTDAGPGSSHPALYWVVTVLAAIAFAVPGILNLVGAPHVVRDMAHLGYPRYFLAILGGWKLLGAVTILLPRLARLKEWAYAGMLFDLTGAAASRALSGDGIGTVAVPLAIGGIVFVSWGLRPAGRRLGSPSTQTA
ncbi:MAG TPA: DoxX family protein [Solirubrobacteraceae bacterium]|jgi:uncharacterized membrane protein YphA (DoxX/SURF4 family)